MKNDNVKHSLDTIRDYISAMKELPESTEAQLIKAQLRLIEKNIKQFEKNGIQIPEGILSDKTSLESKLATIGKGPHELSLLYGELLDLILLTAPILKTWPGRDLRDRIKGRRKEELKGDIFRKQIIASLKEIGGTAEERDIIEVIGDRLKSQFSPSDLESPYGKRPRWVMNARKERKRMMKDGILTPDSKGRKWSLAKIG